VKTCSTGTYQSVCIICRLKTIFVCMYCLQCTNISHIISPWQLV